MTRPALAVFAFLLLAAPDERLARHRNLGKAYFETPTTHAQAVIEFQKALALAPNSTRDRLNLGLSLIANGQTAEGIAELEKVQKADPSIPHTWFNLGIQLKKAGEFDKARTQLEQFVKLVPTEPTGHHNLGTLYRLAGETAKAIAAFEQASKLDPNLAAPHFQLFNLYRQNGRPQEAAARLKLFQEAKDRQKDAAIPEDVEWSFYSEIYDPPAPSAPSEAKPITPRFVSQIVQKKAPGLVVADLNNDGKPELLPYDGAAADFNNDGRPDLCVIGDSPQLLTNINSKLVPRSLPVTGQYSLCVPLDYDRDYDMDILLLGAGTNTLLRNQGSFDFAERTPDFPFQPGHPLTAHVLRVVPDTKGLDVLVTYADHPAILYRDRLAGRFEPEPFPLIPAGERVVRIIGADIQTDRRWLANSNGHYTLRNELPGLLADFDNRGALERHPDLPPAKSYVLADFNLDGKLDVALHASDESLQLLTNTTSTPYKWTRLSIIGTKNLKLASGAEVEIKSGNLYQKRLYAGYPLHFGMGAYPTIDTIRITWPNGLIQNEPNLPTGKPLSYKEAQRLSGSCPQVWTWNGREYQYVTDVLGVAPLGASSGDGQFFPVDHLEHIQLPDLTPKDGYLEVRLTEELAEVAYLDQIRLLAVDHPQSTEIFLNERFQSPPYPPLEVFPVERRVTIHPGPVLDFRNEPNSPLLILRGWTDWADGSLIRQYSQERGRALKPPVLEMQNGNGPWQTAVADLGLPSGKPKAFAVRVPPADRYRIRTNVEVHWTEISLAELKAQPVRISEQTPASAGLRFRGFSRLVQTKPDLFAYANPFPISMWNPTPGVYTRYCDVTPLMDRSDDELVIMGSGDELTLRFDPRRFPPPPPATRRSYVLAVDGWAKDQDPNTAFSQTVGPLPFHRMSAYPYKRTEHHTPGPLHRRYNTRPARKLIPSLGTISD